MRILSALIYVAMSAAPVWAAAENGNGEGKPDGMDIQTDSPVAVHWAKGQGPAANPAGTASNLLYHNGPVMPTTAVQAIFWGKSWNTSPGDKITAIDSWYSGVGSSAYSKTSGEFTGTNGQVSSAISYLGHLMDPSAAPRGAPKTSAILAEVCKEITNPVANGYYPVYVDTKRGNTGYCAWHSWGACGGKSVRFAFFFNLDGDPGCDPGAPYFNLLSQGANSLANVSGHESSEARTDPTGTGWYDRSGAENGDKCAWTFSGKPVVFTYPDLSTTSWKIQGNFSNSANNGGLGYDNGGCIDGNGYVDPTAK